MPHSGVRDSKVEPAKGGRKLSGERLLDLVQRQTFRYFRSAGWRGTAISGAPIRWTTRSPSAALALASWLFLSPAIAGPRRAGDGPKSKPSATRY
jgi:hypothetical protein